MKRVLLFMILFTFVLGTSCYAKTIEEARVLLSQLKIEYNEQVFLKRISEKDTFITNLFLDAGMNPNLVTANKNTPLKIAVMYNNIDAVKELVSRGADVNWKDSTGKTAIDIAQLRGSEDIVALLKSSGAEVNENRLPNNYKPLDSVRINNAMQTGKEGANAKKDIIYIAKDTDKTYGGFLGADIQTMGRAYAISPYCVIANANLQATKKYENLDESKLKIYANTFQVRIVFTFPPMQFNGQTLDDMNIVLLQSGKSIRPYFVQPYPLQTTSQSSVFGVTIWNRIGVIADFNSYDIDLNQPIEVKAITKASKELTFSFKNDNKDVEYYQMESDEYKW